MQSLKTGWGATIIAAWLAGVLLLAAPAIAAPAVAELTPLTPELLQDRLNALASVEGRETINLQRFAIDLREENSEFRDRFYRQLRDRINRSKTPIGLDLSQSVIQGDWNWQTGGIKVQLLEEVVSGQLAAEERDKLRQKLPLDSWASWEGQFESVPYVSLFRGPLKLSETRFQGRVDFSQTLFLKPVEASQAHFEGESNWFGTRFLEKAEFDGAEFAGNVRFDEGYFFETANFARSQFQGIANFEAAVFADRADFGAATFVKGGNWIGASWQDRVSFERGVWRDRALWSQNLFLQPVSFTGATFEKSVALRGSRFNGSIDFREVNLLEQVDLSNATFAKTAFFNVDGLVFDSQAAKLFGDTGRIGKAIRVSRLDGNETVLLNLVRNFRRLEQIPDANQVEYLRSRLRDRQLKTNWLLTPFPQRLGLRAWRELFAWLGLSILLLLSNYGTNVSLVLAAGLLASAYFGLLFWLVDRVLRRTLSLTAWETAAMPSSFAAIALLSSLAMFQTAQQPLLALAGLGLFLLPVPLFLVALLSSQAENLPNTPYFVEDGSIRQLRLLIIRLPILPRFPFYRDRYYPIARDRRWSFLNYYDLSLNNLLKFGFNDIRLRDKNLPGAIAALVWYQWGLGLLYIALFLWTISRTIPGLNLLIYLS